MNRRNTPDLIFHLVSNRNWKNRLREGFYYADSPGEERSQVIPCCLGSEIQEVANRKFDGRRKVLLLVINTHRVSSPISWSEDGKSPEISEKINLDAIIDKIDLTPNTDGRFEVAVEVN